MRAIVLAAGLGTRMRPLTDSMPKPLVPVLGRPLVDYALEFLHAAGVEEAVVNTSYKADMLEAHLQGRTHPRVRISREASPLETGGGIRQALPMLGDAPFVSINSDVICINGAQHAALRLQEAWDDAAMDALLLLHPVARAVGYDGKGDFFLEDGALSRRGDAPSAPYVFAGIQLVHPRLFVGCPPEAPFSMNVLYNRDPARVRGIVHDGDWLHIGDPAGLAAAEAFIQRRRA